MCGGWEGDLLAGKESQDSMLSVGGVGAFAWTLVHLSLGRSEMLRPGKGSGTFRSRRIPPSRLLSVLPAAALVDFKS
jgi:hypothetical protein